MGAKGFHNRDENPVRFIAMALIATALLMTGCYGYVNLIAPAAEDVDRGAITGFVMGDDGPVAGARVRVQATDNVVETDDRGRFHLQGWHTPVRLRTSTLE